MFKDLSVEEYGCEVIVLFVVLTVKLQIHTIKASTTKEEKPNWISRKTKKQISTQPNDTKINETFLDISATPGVGLEMSAHN